jgi:phage major head subunit gpT-like protein
VTKPVIIRGTTIRNLGVTFSTRFQGALKSATSLYSKVSTVVSSGSREQDYAWLMDLPGVREWIGDRVIRQLGAAEYTIRNKSWELTISVDRDDIADDNLGLYSTKIDIMADSTGRHGDELVFSTLKNGFTQLCYDGQYFFDTDHPIKDANGADTTFANTDGGGGNAWFLAATGAALKPIIFQTRQDWSFVSQDSPDADGNFFQKKLYYGADARYNVGYGIPQLCWGSKQTLDAAHYNTARQSLLAMPRDGGGKIAPSGLTLVVGPTNLANAEQILTAQNLANGATNTNYKTADLLVAPWLD